MVVVIEFERHMTGTSVFRIIINEFSHQKTSSTVIQLIIDDGQKLGFHNALLPLGLAISPRIESYRESLFNTEEKTQ